MAEILSRLGGAKFEVLDVGLRDLRKVGRELLLFDDHKPISIGLNQAEMVKSLHEQTDAGRRLPTISDNSSCVILNSRT